MERVDNGCNDIDNVIMNGIMNSIRNGIGNSVGNTISSNWSRIGQFPIPAQNQFQGYGNCSARRMRTTRQFVRRQTAIMDTSVKLMNQGVELFVQGRDRRAVEVLTSALATSRRFVTRKPSKLQFGAAPFRWGSEASSRSKAGSPDTTTTAATTAATATTTSSTVPQTSQTPLPTNAKDGHRFHPTPIQTQSQSPMTKSPPAAGARSTSEAKILIQGQNAARAPSSQATPSLHTDHFSVNANVDMDEVVMFDNFHVAFPIHKKVQQDHQQKQQHQQQDLQHPASQSSLAPCDATMSSPSFYMYNKAFTLSPEEIKAARDYYHIVRNVEFECEYDDDEDFLLEEEDFEALAMSIEGEFLDLVLPMVSACIVYNMALLFDIQARCMRTLSNHDGHGQSHIQHSPSKASYFARKAHTLYNSVLRLLQQDQWLACGTAALLRLAAMNNRAVLRLEHRLPGMQTRMTASLRNTAQTLVAMIRYIDKHFRPSANINSNCGSCMSKCEMDSILLNTCLWMMDNQCNTDHPYFATAA